MTIFRIYGCKFAIDIMYEPIKFFIMKKALFFILALWSGLPVAYGTALTIADVDSLRSSAPDSLSRSLEEVTVTASTVERTGNQERITITRDLRQGAVNTVQMLGNIQGMFLNRSNNSLTYMGSDKIVILVDSMEKDVDYVKALNHMRFDKIDVVHNPTGKYSDYDVLINLRRKEVYEGYEGMLSGAADIYVGDRNGKNHNFGHGVTQNSFTYTRDKWNFFVSQNYDWQDNAYSEFSETSYPLNNFKEAVISGSDKEPNHRDYSRNSGSYIGVDYDINKNHSLSLTYYLGNTSIDNYSNTLMLSGDMSAFNPDTIQSSVTFRDKGYRHTIGVYYRGRSGLWSYNANFNYTNNGWRTWSHNRRSSGFFLEDNRRNQQNYIWGNAEVSRRTSDGKWYFALGYMNYWKEYWIKRLSTLDLLSKTINRRNDVYITASYNPSPDWSVGISGSLQMVSNQSQAQDESYLLNSISAWGFHKFSNKAWMRVNYYSAYNQPSISQISDYGQFSDSLLWSGGNPSLRAYTSHRVTVTAGLFNIFNVEGVAFFAPKSFASIVEMREGMRPDGTIGPYAATQWQNTNLRQWHISVSASKRIGRFGLNALARWQDIYAEYHDFSHHMSGPAGYFSANYNDNAKQLYVQLVYQISSAFSAAPQSEGKNLSDYMLLYVQKSFLKGKLTASCSYIIPLHILSGKSWSRTESPVLQSYVYSNNQFRNNNRLSLSIVYRFSGGKSVRKYNREMRQD